MSVGIGLLIGAPWLIRNTLLYGDPVAQHIFLTAFKNTATHADWMSGKFTHGVPISEAMYWQLVSMLTFHSFWFKPEIADGIAQIESLALTVVMVIGAGLYLMRRLSALPAGQMALVGGYLTLIVLTLAAFVRFNMVFFQAQGRYLYTALVPIAFLAVAGISELFPARLRSAVLVCVAGLLAAMSASMLHNMADAFNSLGGGA
jgi:hypothetical protein